MSQRWEINHVKMEKKNRSKGLVKLLEVEGSDEVRIFPPQHRTDERILYPLTRRPSSIKNASLGPLVLTYVLSDIEGHQLWAGPRASEGSPAGRTVLLPVP